MSQPYPWRTARTVEQVINANRDLLIRTGIIEPGPGYSPAELRAIERRTHGPLPDEIKQLYAAARPRQVGADHWPSMGLFKPDGDIDVRWYHLLDDQPHPIDLIVRYKPSVPGFDNFKHAHGLMLAGNPFFDRLFWVRGHATMPDGCIMLTDHEGYPPMPIVARSLSQYLARLCFFNGTDLITYPGQRGDFPLDHALLFAREFAELNPDESDWSEWAARALIRKEHPFGHPLGYHHWDKSRKQLVPIREAGDVSKINLTHPTRADIESISDAGRCRCLTLINAPALNLAPLARLHTLDELYIYDVTEVDAGPLAQNPTLRDVCFLRCQVKNLAALARSPSLKRLRLPESQFPEDDLDTVRRGRPGIGIER
jgi:hypothetical protein